MSSKVLIAPVGVYPRRVWRSIARSGARKVYLLAAKMGPYKEITNRFARELQSDIKKFLMLRESEAVEIRQVSFQDLKDIYRTYSMIIEHERKQNSRTELVLDITSAPMEAVLASTLIARLYGADLTYVQPQLKRSESFVERRIAHLDDEQKDEGEDPPLEVQVGKWRGLDSNEFRAMKKIYETKEKGFASMTEFIKSIAEEDGGKNPSDPAYKRAWIRVIHELRDKGVVQIMEKTGTTRAFKITEAGIGIVEGNLDYMRQTGDILVKE